jgi:hypothetical protein
MHLLGNLVKLDPCMIKISVALSAAMSIVLSLLPVYHSATASSTCINVDHAQMLQDRSVPHIDQKAFSISICTQTVLR